MPRRIESLFLDGPAGRLEALLEEPDDGDPRQACLVCHPHPLYGGTMHNKVVYRIARGMRRAGAVVLRFNFRGVGRSEGRHDHGAGEADDARAALAWLRGRYPHLPHSLAGFSFGSRVILRTGCGSGAQRLIAVGIPTRKHDYTYLSHCQERKVFLQSTSDEHGPRPELEALYTAVADPKQIHWIDAQDHFFNGALDQLEERVFELGSTA